MSLQLAAGCGDVSRCPSTPAQAVTYHPFDATAKYQQHTEQARNVTWSHVPSTLSRYGVTLRGNVTSVYLPLQF